jgi:hypothetical protein
VFVHTLCKEKDPDTEALHWCEAMSLAQQVYRAPWKVLQVSDMLCTKDPFCSLHRKSGGDSRST